MKLLKEISEQKIQSKIIKKLEANGCFVLKLIKCNKNGYPDLLVIKNNEVSFIEVKKKEGKLSELQKARIIELKERGVEVKIWQDYNIDFK